MKVSWLCLVAVMGLALSGCMELKGKELVGAQAPESRLMFFDGSEVPLSSYQGKNVAILFWATWCSHSRTVVERYEAIARWYSQRSDIEFIAVSVDKNEDFGLLKDRIKEQGLHSMTHIFSGNDALDDAFVNLNGKHIPYLVFIDRRGIVQFVDTDIAPFEEFMTMRYGLQ
jgi:hypothetical protein